MQRKDAVTELVVFSIEGFWDACEVGSNVETAHEPIPQPGWGQ